MISTATRQAAPERSVEQKAEIVPYLQGVLETTTRRGDQVNVKSEVLFTLHTTRISTKTTEKFKNIAETTINKGDGGGTGEITFISPKGRLLASARAGNPETRKPEAEAQDGNSSNIVVLGRKTPAAGLERILTENQARKTVVRDEKQLKEALRIADKMELQEIYAPKKLIEAIKDPATKNAGILKPLPQAETAAIRIADKNGLMTGIAAPPAQELWSDIKLPDIKKIEAREKDLKEQARLKTATTIITTAPQQDIFAGIKLPKANLSGAEISVILSPALETIAAAEDRKQTTVIIQPAERIPETKVIIPDTTATLTTGETAAESAAERQNSAKDPLLDKLIQSVMNDLEEKKQRGEEPSQSLIAMRDTLEIMTLPEAQTANASASPESEELAAIRSLRDDYIKAKNTRSGLSQAA